MNNKAVTGCEHSRERMNEWMEEGACPICLCASAGIQKERAEKAEAESRVLAIQLETCRQHSTTLREIGDQMLKDYQQTTLELEHERKAAAEMRAVLKWMWDEAEMGYIERPGLPRECGQCGRAGGHSDECWQAHVERALSSDAGRDYVHRDGFKILVEALREIEAHPDARHQIVQVCKRTIAAAHEKGIIS